VYHESEQAFKGLGVLDRLRVSLNDFDLNIVRWLARHSIMLLRIGMGIVFLWFGALKFFPSVSPAEDLALQTMGALTLELIPTDVSRILLATLEVAIGIGLIAGRYLRPTLLAMAFHMLGTLTPLILFPERVFDPSLLVPTLEGQYIIKNVVLVGAGLVVGSTVRGGRIVVDPAARRDDHRPAAPSARRSLFPGALVLITTLALAACGGGVSQAGEPPPQVASASSESIPSASDTAGEKSGDTTTVNVVTKEFIISLDPAPISAGSITFVVKNEGHTPHDFAITIDGVLRKTSMIDPGKTASLSVKLQPGTYTYVCTVWGHAMQGMRGTFTVA
jgi:uncharacterized cupredoxin-like copper-binding protein/uncharacterized membrane protein YkgB